MEKKILKKRKKGTVKLLIFELTEMATEDCKRKMEYNQCLTGDSDSSSISNGDQTVGRLYGIEMKRTCFKQVILGWILDQNKFLLKNLRAPFYLLN